MGVVSPEREREREVVEPRREAPPPPQPPRPDGGPPWGLIALLTVLIALLAGVNWIRDVFPDFELRNPFAAETVDRSGPAVLRSVQDIGEYRAAAGHFEVIVDVEKDTALPRQLLGERTLFVAVGRVDAGVDLSQVGADDVEVSQDRRSAALTLPSAELFPAQLDIGESYVYDRDRGVFTEIASLFSDDSGNQQEIYRLAERKLNEAAAAPESGLDQRAERNTRTMLTSLLRALGFTNVTIRFED